MPRPPVVRLLGRTDCHLCDEAREQLLAIRDQGAGFRLEELDIDRDDELLRRHLERIPVVEVDGVEVSTLVLDVPAVRAALDR